jgi:Domain of unknown function (DUF4389)
VLLRVVLAIPHLVWVYVWGIAAVLFTIAAWFAALVQGRTPVGLHDFLAAYLRYSTWVWGYVFLISDPFPSFGGAPGAYPLRVDVDPPERQSRWTIAFRLVLALPMLLLESVVESVVHVIAVLGWFVGLVLGRMPDGMRAFGVFGLDLRAKTFGYVMLLTGRYPAIDIPKPG